MEIPELAYIDPQSVSSNYILKHFFRGWQVHKLTIILEGGHGKSAKLKDFVAFRGIFLRSQTGISIVDSSPGANVSIVYGM